MTEKETMELSHRLLLEEREKMRLSGVKDVESFDEQAVLLLTTRGALKIEGENLHIEGLQLETGDLTLSGKVNNFTYSDRGPRRSLLGKIFR
jgi:sporulation protein YabP